MRRFKVTPEAPNLTVPNPPHHAQPVTFDFRARGIALEGTTGTFDQTGVGLGLDVVFDPLTRRCAMLYGGYNGTKHEIGLAYADGPLGPWVKANSGSPVLTLNPTPGTFDAGGLAFPQLHREGGTWYMYYIGFDALGLEVPPAKIGLATCPVASGLDGPWTRHANNPLVVPGDITGLDAEADNVYRPNVNKIDGSYYMFFNAGPFGSESIYYATATSPLGPFAVTQTPIVQRSSSQTPWAGNTLVSDPQLVDLGDQYAILFWAVHTAGSSGIGAVYCDRTAFPDGPWEAATAATGETAELQSIVHFDWQNGAQRPVFKRFGGKEYLFGSRFTPSSTPKMLIWVADREMGRTPWVLYGAQDDGTISGYIWKGTGTDITAAAATVLGGKKRVTWLSPGLRNDWREVRVRGQIVANVQGASTGTLRLKQGSTTVQDFPLANGANSIAVDTFLKRDLVSGLDVSLAAVVASAGDSVYVQSIDLEFIS